MNFSKFYTFCILSILLITSACKKDYNEDFPTSLDSRLEKAIDNASNGVGKSFYILPESDGF